MNRFVVSHLWNVLIVLATVRSWRKLCFFQLVTTALWTRDDEQLWHLIACSVGKLSAVLWPRAAYGSCYPWCCRSAHGRHDKCGCHMPDASSACGWLVFTVAVKGLVPSFKHLYLL
jgi:hypothetical protein